MRALRALQGVGIDLGHALHNDARSKLPCRFTAHPITDTPEKPLIIGSHISEPQKCVFIFVSAEPLVGTCPKIRILHQSILFSNCALLRYSYINVLDSLSQAKRSAFDTHSCKNSKRERLSKDLRP